VTKVIPGAAVIVALIIGLPLVLLFILRVAILLQEVFQRLGQIDKSVGRHSNNKNCELNEGQIEDMRLLIDRVIDTAATKVVRRERLGLVARLWTFLAAPSVAYLPRRKISTVGILRIAQRITANPYRWCDYAPATDRWGRPTRLALLWFGAEGHRFSDIGGFWYVVTHLRMENKLDNLDDAYWQCLEALVSFTGRLVSWEDRGYHGSTLAVAQYELAIRACCNDLETVNSIAAVINSESSAGNLLLTKLQHIGIHISGSSDAI
jgi:hypothetical protein